MTIKEPCKTLTTSVFEANNVIILQRHGDVKRMLNDYQGALKDLNKADFLEPNNAFILQSHADVKKNVRGC
jgi:hypothetical protein